MIRKEIRVVKLNLGIQSSAFTLIPCDYVTCERKPNSVKRKLRRRETENASNKLSTNVSILGQC